MSFSPTADQSGRYQPDSQSLSIVGDEILTVFDAARFLKLDEKTVRKLAKAGELPCFKAGAQFRFTKSALLELGKGSR